MGISSSDAAADPESAGIVKVPFFAKRMNAVKDDATPGRMGCIAPMIPGAEIPLIPIDVGL